MKYCKDYREYWDWVEKRNEYRYQNNLEHGKNYDSKNMMHTFRLLYACEHVLEAGEPLVRVTGDRLAFLMSIRAGQHAYDELVKRASALIEELEASRDRVKLPHRPEATMLDALLGEITATWENERGWTN